MTAWAKLLCAETTESVSAIVIGQRVGKRKGLWVMNVRVSIRAIDVLGTAVHKVWR